RQAVALAPRSAITPLPALGDEIEIATDPQQSRADVVGVGDERCGRIALAANNGPAGAEDARLLAPDILAGRPEIIHVVQIDARHDCDVSVDQIDRVETPAQADLEHERV